MRNSSDEQSTAENETRSNESWSETQEGSSPFLTPSITPLSSPFLTPTITPSSSFSTFDRALSSCSESSVDALANSRHGLDYDTARGIQNTTVEAVNNPFISDRVTNNGYNESDSVRGRTIQAIHNLDVEKANDNDVGNTDDCETPGADPRIWDPPDPEIAEDNIVKSNTKIGDDDSSDGPTDENTESYRFRQEKQQAIQKAVKIKFKATVSELLKSMGVTSKVEDGWNWVDIATSVSEEAVSLLKPVLKNREPINPKTYVKVKCIASGSPSQSEVVNGLVFKKNVARKHMATEIKKPKLLLIKDVDSQSPGVYSKFTSLDKEDKHEKQLADLINKVRPNVVLFESTISRGVQELVLDKGITLVFDMKLKQLKRVAACIGLELVPYDSPKSESTKQCELFLIEKIVEEHAASGEGGKKAFSTLMFLKGFPTRLGCTILLKGSDSAELKKIKKVVQYGFVLAYHLILETSFLIDQQAMFFTFPSGEATKDIPLKQLPAIGTGEIAVPHVDKSTTETEVSAVMIPILSKSEEQSFLEKGGAEGENIINSLLDGESVLSYEYNPCTPNEPLSASLKKVTEKDFPYHSMSGYFGVSEEPYDNQLSEAVPVTMDENNEKKSFNDGATKTVPDAAMSQRIDKGNKENKFHSYTDISEAAADSDRILVLMSKQNEVKGSMCEQRRFSHLFYKDYDDPLGKFLLDTLFNQKCKTCEDSAEAHCYFYAHRNKQLTIQIKRTPLKEPLPLGSEGKLWMWSRCRKCKSKNGTSTSTKRVLLSTAACGLSFGKFLELCFSQLSSFHRLSSCGHSLGKDFLHFFGSGYMVAMLRFSRVTTYTVSLPPQKLKLSSSIGASRLEQEFEKIFDKGHLLFEEIGAILKKNKSQFVNSTLNLGGSLKTFKDVEEMLKNDRSDFESVCTKIQIRDVAANRLLGLNWVRWELFLQAVIWDRRLHSLLTVVETGKSEKIVLDIKSKSEEGHTVSKNNGKSQVLLDTPVQENEISVREISIDGPDETSHVNEDLERQHMSVKESRVGSPPSDSISLSDQLQTIPFTKPVGIGSAINGKEISPNAFPTTSRLLELRKSDGWFWLPFREIQKIHIKDLQEGTLSKYESICTYNPEQLSTAKGLIKEEGSRLHIPIKDDCVVSDYEQELSSLIACALALSNDPLEGRDEEGQRLLRHQSLNVSDSAPMSLETQRYLSLDVSNLLDSSVPGNGHRREVSFGTGKSVGKSNYFVSCLFAEQFCKLRKQCLPSEHDYIASLSRCKRWDAKGGKSKSFFAKTLDDRFIIKEIQKTELDSFEKAAIRYFKHMEGSFLLGNQTCLAKILGIYQVVVRHFKSGKETKQDVMVMENLTFNRTITRQYDLKGALHARYITATDVEGDVLLDQNFVDDMNSSPLYVSKTSMHSLQRAVWNDTSFLDKNNVMDYSLVVGVDVQNRELVCGIIDYLREYTWDKLLETWVKYSIIPKNTTPTVISPKDYKKRFRTFMSKNFSSVPDEWCVRASPSQDSGAKEIKKIDDTQ